MDRISKKAYAKINLHLDVVSRYSDGYHEVNTIMQSISLADEVSVVLEGERINIFCDRSDVPSDERNIAWKAAGLFLDECRSKGVSVRDGVLIKIVKNTSVSLIALVQ